jgi:hypothetical protein
MVQLLLDPVTKELLYHQLRRRGVRVLWAVRPIFRRHIVKCRSPQPTNTSFLLWYLCSFKCYLIVERALSQEFASIDDSSITELGSPEEIKEMLADDFGCTQGSSTAENRITVANAIYKATALTWSAGGLLGFLLAHSNGDEFTVHWPDGSTGRYHISANDPRFSVNLTAENSCTVPA